MYLFCKTYFFARLLFGIFLAVSLRWFLNVLLLCSKQFNWAKLKVTQKSNFETGGYCKTQCLFVLTNSEHDKNILWTTAFVCLCPLNQMLNCLWFHQGAVSCNWSLNRVNCVLVEVQETGSRNSHCLLVKMKM